ncbi:MAG: IS1595 family transposase [Chloroflexota bacterium]|nr:IS1595 family transposase [Chloroflexota bacterium]MDE2935539.1 IS1595 family transposase [Chloroflexota bacterium]
MTVMELFDRFPDEQSAREWFEETRWPDGPICPRCDSGERVSQVRSGKPLPWRCLDCKKFFSVKVGTVMEQSPLPLRKWVVGVYLMTASLKGVSSMKLHRDLGITQKSAWFMTQRIREGWMTGQPLDGEVEVDETYIGGKERNRHPSRRRGIRGPSSKAIVVGARSRDGEIRAQHVAGATRRNLLGFVTRNVTQGSTIYTDEHRAYRQMPGYRHYSVNHSTAEYVNGQAHVNGMESFWAMLKRGYHGTFHHVSQKHFGRHVTEFAGRQSRRDLGTMAQMALIARTMVGRRLTYRQLTR